MWELHKPSRVKQMAHTQIKIYFDNSSATYSPGERVSGKVLFVLEAEKPIVGVDLNRIGVAQVTGTGWNGEVHGPRRKRTRRGSKCNQISLLKGTIQLTRENRDVHQKLPAGTYVFPFSWQLPPNLPSSFEGPYGWIGYRLEVIVRYSHYSLFMDHRCEAAADFVVQSKLDLNTVNVSWRHVAVETKWIYLFTDHGRDYLELSFELEKKAYAPGETVRFAATPDYQSEGGESPLSGVEVSLIQEQTYRIGHNLKRNLLTIANQVGPQVIPNVVEVWNGVILVPQLIPTAVGGGCPLIDIQYYVNVKVGLTDTEEINFSLKILIGTDPITKPRPPLLGAEGCGKECSLELPPPTPVSGSPVHRKLDRLLNAHEQMLPTPMGMNYLNPETPGTSRRASAPPIWLSEDVPCVTESQEESSNLSQPEDGANQNGNNDTSDSLTLTDAIALSSIGFLETAVPGCSRQLSIDESCDSNSKYRRPLILRETHSHLFDQTNGYSTL